MFELKNISKSYAGRNVLEVDDLRIPEKAITSLAGPNGAGKSTLLRLIAFLQRPETGSIRFRGEEVRFSRLELVDIRRKVTLVEQNPFIFRGTVYSNVTYGLRVRGVPRRELKERAKEALESVGLEDFEGRDARSLSGGEQQRLALARAVILRPLALLLDEPTAHVDPSRTASIENLIKNLQRERNLTIVLATHDPAQAQNLTDRIIILDSGRVVKRQGNGDYQGGN